MTNSNIQVVRVTGAKASFLGGKVNVYVAMNRKDEYGFLPGENKPYMPIGGKKTLLSVIDILEFKPFN